MHLLCSSVPLWVRVEICHVTSLSLSLLPSLSFSISLSLTQNSMSTTTTKFFFSKLWSGGIQHTFSALFLRFFFYQETIHRYQTGQTVFVLNTQNTKEHRNNWKAEISMQTLFHNWMTSMHGLLCVQKQANGSPWQNKVTCFMKQCKEHNTSNCCGFLAILVLNL